MFGRDWLKERREASRPLPSGDPPNVLLIVLDTVRADRLSLYGYRRPTSPTLERLARRGVRFDEARATAPWTLPSHASLFTGRWPHELDVNWNTRLGTKFPTLAEYLGSRGYATAGFVANVLYCSYEFGLDRGFTHYEDYVLEPMTPLRMCYLGDLALKAVSHLGWRLSASLGVIPFLPHKDSPVWRALNSDPKIDAGLINREFLDWLSRRREPGRPFFAFLNYFDAHTGVPASSGYSVPLRTAPEDRCRCPGTGRVVPPRQAPAAPLLTAISPEIATTVVWVILDEQLGELFDELRASWRPRPHAGDRHLRSRRRDWESTACSSTARRFTAPRSACPS